MLIECLERIHAAWEAKQRQLCTEDCFPHNRPGRGDKVYQPNQAALNHSINNDSQTCQWLIFSTLFAKTQQRCSTLAMFKKYI